MALAGARRRRTRQSSTANAGDIASGGIERLGAGMRVGAEQSIPHR